MARVLRSRRPEALRSERRTGAQPIDEPEGDVEPDPPGGVVVVLLRAGNDDFVRRVGNGDLDTAMAEVDAHELPGSRVEGEPLGWPPAALAAGGVGVHHDDRASMQEASGDLRQGGAGQTHDVRDLTTAERSLLTKSAQDALLVSAPDQRMHSSGRCHGAKLGTVEFFRQHSHII